MNITKFQSDKLPCNDKVSLTSVENFNDDIFKGACVVLLLDSKEVVPHQAVTADRFHLQTEFSLIVLFIKILNDITA